MRADGKMDAQLLGVGPVTGAGADCVIGALR